MKRALAIALLLAACGGGGGSTGDDGDDGDDTATPDADPGAPDAGVPAPYCVLGCTTPADCATGDPGTIIDADNYDCDAGHCVWLGCNSTQECTATFQNPDYTCAQAFGVTLATCWPTCTTAPDCTTASTLYDLDNYECAGNKCHWTGCNSTQECTDAFQSPDYVCAPITGGVDTCLQRCDTPADCGNATAPYDGDNYECDGGACMYIGCNSTQECQAIGAAYVCTTG